jgi:filamentous hemagglutinin
MIQQQAGRNSPYLFIFPGPLFLNAAPTAATQAEIGQAAIVQSANAIYWCVNRVGSVYTWAAQSSGSASLAALTVNPGDIDITAGNLNVTAGDINATAGTTTLNILASGNTTVNGTLDVTGLSTFTGDVVFNGDVDISSTDALSFTTTSNTAPAISFVTNGGTTETLVLTNTQGSNAAAIDLNALAGGITLDAAGAISLDAAAASNFSVTGAGIDLTLASASGQVNITGGEANATAISLDATNGAGGVTIAAGTGGLNFGNQADCTTIGLGDFAPTASRTISIGGGTVVTAAVTDTVDIGPDGATTNANSIKTVNINGGGVTTGEVLTNIATGAITSGTHTVSIQSGNAAAGTVVTNISTGTGTKSVNIGNADDLTTTTILGIVDINTGASTAAVAIGNAAAGAITIDSAAGISLDAATASNFTTSGAAADLTLEATAGSVNIIGGEAAVLNAVRIDASAADGGIDIDSGTNGITIDTTGAFSIDGAAASNVTTTGAGIDLTLSSVLGSVLVSSTEDAALAIRLHANGGTSESIQLHSDLGTGVGSINLLSDVGGITLTATGLASADAINLEATAGGVDVDAALQINIASSQAAADALRLVASAGGIDVDAVGSAGVDISIVNTGGSIILQATESVADSVLISSTAGGIDILASGAAAGEDIDIIATGSSVNITSTEADSGAIVISATNAAGRVTLSGGTTGGIAFSSSGIVTMAAATDSQASPTATATINANVGYATFTGFTTASTAAQVFIITNSVATTTSQIFVTASNEGANDAQMTVTRVERLAGSFEVTLTNNGAAALNSDVGIGFWIIG